LKSYSDEGFEKTEVLNGIDENAKVIIDFIKNTKHSYDVCADSTVPSLIIKTGALRKSYVEFVARAGHIRFITEITKENLSSCKEIMKLVELRHIEGIKGIVRINEKEFQSNLAVQESKLTSILFHSTLEEVVKAQQCVYDSLWKLAIPAGERIKDLETEQKEVGHESSVTKKNHNALQLWTDADQTEHAITFEGKSKLLAATNQNAQYTQLVEQSDYFEELEYNWEYTLKQWINNITASKLSASSYGSGGIGVTTPTVDKKGVKKRRHISSKPMRFDCNFCKLHFDSNRNRLNHEQMWHGSTSAPGIR
jgi:hypothetical protein